MSVESDLFDAARNGDVAGLSALLDRHPDKLHARADPYECTLLHTAAQKGHLPVVDELLKRGFDPNTRERGDNTYAMHWAAAAGRLDIVRRLADAGGDVIGRGDDHDLEVIGWATCWQGGDDAAHREVADFLVSRGARHHIFSAIAMNLADEVRRIAAADPSAVNRRQTRNEDHRTALQFAVLMNRPGMVALLIELGADPLAVDGAGRPVAHCASTPDIDRPVMEKIRDMLLAELDSAVRGQCPARVGPADLIALLALGDLERAEQLVRSTPKLIEPAGGALHMMAQRNDAAAVNWLLAHGTDVNGRWKDGDVELTALHLAVRWGHTEIVRLLLAAGADPTFRDSMHDGDATGWAEHFGREEIIRILKDHGAHA